MRMSQECLEKFWVFFSSRRRHTRWNCDWSSDVCSSDLLMGDFVLAEVGNILRSCVRGSDIIIRYGGDEFVLVLSETDLLGSEVVVNRIHKKVKELGTTNRVARFELSVSTGIAIFAEGKKVTDLRSEERR